MPFPAFEPLTCTHCVEGADLNFEITMAFQPIVDVENRVIFSYEALVRGKQNEPAGYILGLVNDENRYRFDQTCRVKAIQLAARLQLPCYLNINFLPNAVYRPETCIRTTLEAAQRFQFPADRIIFEITEGEEVTDRDHLKAIIAEYQRLGFQTAIDDFGAGYAGLNLLAEYQPNFVKLDMKLIRNIHQDRVRQVIVGGIVQLCKELNITMIAEGIESQEELEILHAMDVHLFQGYLFARPGFESLPAISWDALPEKIKP